MPLTLNNANAGVRCIMSQLSLVCHTITVPPRLSMATVHGPPPFMRELEGQGLGSGYND